MSQTENSHLRELLRRLQDENLMLKQSTFTFSVPRPSMSSDGQNFQNVATTSFHGLGDSTSPQASSSTSPPSTSTSKPDTPHMPSSLDGPSTFPADIDFGSLTPFDSSMMNLLDDNTNDQEMYDFGGFGHGVQPTQTAYKTIASNPQYMSFVDPLPDNNATLGSINKDSPSNSSGSGQSPFDFFNWSSPARSQTGSSTRSAGGGSLDELFGGSLFSQAQSPVEFTVLMKSPSPLANSPVVHRSSPPAAATPSSGAGNSPPTDKLSHDTSPCGTEHRECPKTKAELEKHISSAGNSIFAPPVTTEPVVRKSTLPETGAPMIMCKGATFPPTEASEHNVEVLSAWRSITSHPQFKAAVRVSTQSPCGRCIDPLTCVQNVDINELCSDFTSKARCDGTKVVLDQEGVNAILEKLSGKLASQASS